MFFVWILWGGFCHEDTKTQSFFLDCGFYREGLQSFIFLVSQSRRVAKLFLTEWLLRAVCHFEEREISASSSTKIVELLRVEWIEIHPYNIFCPSYHPWNLANILYRYNLLEITHNKNKI